MRALRCELRVQFNHPCLRRVVTAGFFPFGKAAKQTSNPKFRQTRKHSDLIHLYSERHLNQSNALHNLCCLGDNGGGGRGGVHTGRTNFGHEDDGPPNGHYGLVGVVITLACANLYGDREYTPVDAASSHSKALTCYSNRSDTLSGTPLQVAASKLEDATPIPQQVSVQEAFAGRTVLLTGVTGFVGSLVLEHLLRTCPNVRKVFVIVRHKHGTAGPNRLQQMLHANPLFHFHRGSHKADTYRHRTVSPEGSFFFDNSGTNCESVSALDFSPVEAITGDITLPGYGIAPSDMHRLQQQTDIVIHTAASISFDDHIHDAITRNYMATKHLADMAASMPNLKAFLHVSTAYVNGNQPKGSTVAEVMLPLVDPSDLQVHHADLVRNLQVLPRPQAALQAQHYMQQWRFPNNYCFSKHLAESLMADYHKHCFPVAIVRPSIIGALAGSPLPGYVGNTAGSTGAALAIATGIAAWTCHQPSSTFDVVPGDVVSSTVLAAAASTAQRQSRRGQPLIVHACTSSQNRLTTGQFFEHIQAYFTLHPPPFRVIMRPYPRYQGCNVVASEHMRAARSGMAEAKFAVICAVLRAAGQGRLAKKLFSGWKAWQKYNRPALDFDLCFQTDNLRQLQESLPADEQQLFRLSWEGASWQRYMRTYMAGVQYCIFKQPTLADDTQHDFSPWPIVSTLRSVGPKPAAKSQSM